jgi:hypothetical protein
MFVGSVTSYAQADETQEATIEALQAQLMELTARLDAFEKEKNTNHHFFGSSCFRKNNHFQEGVRRLEDQR